MVKDIEFREEEEDFKQAGYSINEIILRHIRKISDLCCKEFVGSYWTKMPIKTQSGVIFIKTYHEDSREAYCNAVDFLIDVVYPRGDKELKNYIDGNDCGIITNGDDDIKERMETKRLIFKEINKMFERINFWNSSDISYE